MIDWWLFPHYFLPSATGERILDGESRLLLTTGCLAVVNDGFRAILDSNDANSSFEALPGNCWRLPDLDDLQFLYDFVQKTRSLKVGVGGTVAQGRWRPLDGTTSRAGSILDTIISSIPFIWYQNCVRYSILDTRFASLVGIIRSTLSRLNPASSRIQSNQVKSG